jgi:hypothetical protein
VSAISLNANEVRLMKPREALEFLPDPSNLIPKSHA